MEYSIKVKTDNRVVMFLYALMQGGVHVKQVEEAVDAAMKFGAKADLLNGPLAVMAQEAARILVGHGTIGIQAAAGMLCSKCGTIYLAADYHKFNEVQGKSQCPKCGEPWKKDSGK
jgi:hypothetical protein